MADVLSSRPDYGPIFAALSKANAGDDYSLNEKVVSAFQAFDASLAPIPDAARASLLVQCLDFYDWRLGDSFRLSLLNQAYDIYRSCGLHLEAAGCAYSIASIYDDEDNCSEVLLWTDRAIEGGADYVGVIQAYRLQVNCLSSVKRYEGALVSLASYREHIRKYGSDSPADLAAFFIIKASVCYEQGRYTESVSAYSDALKNLPEFSPLRLLITYNTGAVLARSGFFDEGKLLMQGARSKWLSADFRVASPSYASDLEELAESNLNLPDNVCPELLGYWCLIHK
jgi:tetratricopeptide (TPR) repeat protein